MKNLLLTLVCVIGIITVSYSQCNRYLIYESFSNVLTTQGGTWAVNSILASTTPVRTGGYVAGFNGAGDWIRTPQIPNPGVLTFWYRRSTNTTAWTLRVQTSPDGVTWTTRSSVTNATTTYQQHTLNIGALGLTNVFIRLFDNRASGAQERYVDDLGITSTVTNENLLIPFLGNCSQTLTSTLTYTITDAGGPTDTYNNSLNQVVTFTPSDNTKKLRLDFTVFNLEDTYDYLYVYDGPNTSSTLLATLSGTAIPTSITAENVSGQLTLRFTSDASAVRVGFSATVTSITPPPVCTIPTEGGTLTSNKTETVVNDAISLTTTGNGGLITKIEFSYDNFATIDATVNNPVNPYVITLNVQEPTIYFRTTSKDGNCPIGVSNIVGIQLESAPVFTNGIVDGDHITNVTLSNINNNSTNDGDSYQDFTTQIIDLTREETYTLSATAANTLNPGQGYAAWIDWNADGTFQTTENIMQKAPANTTSQSITVPVDAVIGDTKMRILSAWNATPSTDAYYSTGYGYGEIEEYTVRISAAVALPVELTKFTATPHSDYNMIKWTTSSESNSDYYTLLSSEDGESWVEIRKENAAGNSVEELNYLYIDYTKKELTYYKLRQFDKNGNNKTYGPILAQKLISSKVILKYINILGQDINPQNTKGLIIIVYNDGTTQKIINH